MRGYEVILFDLLSALLDSWSLWNRVAGDPARGVAWREVYLRRTSEAGAYEPYTRIVAEAAQEVGLGPSAASELFGRWGSVQPWPEAPAVVAALSGHLGVGVVTNCSDVLAGPALRAVGVPFDTVVTAEGVGWYKPRLEPYEAALTALGTSARRTLYVAGSPFDVLGAAGAGMAVYWHNRRGIRHEAAARSASWIEPTLSGVPVVVGAPAAR